MDVRQVELVQASFAKVVPIADQAAVIFYAELFELDPSLRSLFKEDMSEQRRKLMSMLGMAVNGLRDWEAVRPIVASLGVRHVSYGVKPENFATVGTALLAALAQGLGDEFTPEVRAAWGAIYSELASEMLRAAETAAV
jgi:hemoglobin-like flavoprotein